MDQSSSHFHSQDPEGVKFIIDAAESAADRSEPLPETYGDNRLVLLVRDPFWFFAYWEINSERSQSIETRYGADVWQKTQAVLRVYDATDGSAANGSSRFFDIDVNLQTRQWYVRVPESGHSYEADLGLRFPDGRFVSLLHSNRVTLPSGRISDKIDSQWVSVRTSEEEWGELLNVSGLQHVSSGHLEASKGFAQRWEFLRAVFSGGSSRLSSSGAWLAPQERFKENKI